MSDVTPTDGVDFLIVGGGSAGAVLARRLSEDPAIVVLLLEAGPAYENKTFPRDLLDPTRLGDPAHDWGYTADTGLRDQPVAAWRGKVLGGSSAVNAAAAARARPSDFAKWTARGLDNWGFEEVSETYRILESSDAPDDAIHGRTGPLRIHHEVLGELTPSNQAFAQAAQNLGYPFVADFAGAAHGGVAPYSFNIADGARQNTALAYLTDEVRQRPNLTIAGGTQVDSVIFSGTSAIGVRTIDGTAYTADQVILSAGAFGSASILMRSGVGVPADLERHGLRIVADLPVGQRFQDHPFFYSVHALNPTFRSMSPPAGVLLWTASSLAAADDLDLHISATHLVDGSISDTGGAVVIAAGVVQPESIGSVQLRSADPSEAPLIRYNFLGTPRDRARMLEAAKLGRQIAADPAFAKVDAGELVPGPLVTSDEDLARAIRQDVVPYHHASATIPMGGANDEWAVVDGHGHVYGTSNLRVIDASIMPQVPSNATNLTTIMIAEHIFGSHSSNNDLLRRHCPYALNLI